MVIAYSKGMKYRSHIILLSVCALGFPMGVAAARLVKGAGSETVYYVDDGGVRHAYPSRSVFISWHSPQFPISNFQFPNIEAIESNELAAMKLGENVMMRPGSFIKIQTTPQVYAVEQGGILRPIIGEQTAIDLYGKDWAKKVVDVPEVFFFNYKIGVSVRSRADLPDGTLVKLEHTPAFGDPSPAAAKALAGGQEGNPISGRGAGVSYYYKDKGVLTGFKSEAVVRENNLEAKNAVTIPQLFPIRSRTIVGRELRITDPEWGIPLNSADCAADSLKAAVLYLSKGNSGAVEEINRWRTATASAWERRTDVLSLMTMNPAEESTFDDRYLQAKGGIDVQEIARSYFDTHRDDIDFLIIWNAVVPAGSTEIAEFWPVTNSAEGLGKPLFERGELYGSRGKLKGVIHMGRPGDYPLNDSAGMARAVETGVHEFLHQWSGEADFRDLTGADRTELQTSDTYHWSPYVDIISPLGGWGWQDNGDGTFTSQRALLTASQLANLQFPDLDLYLMGLVPRHSVAPFRYVKPDKPSDTLAATMKGSVQKVTIDEVVYGNGVRRCMAP